ncbi:DUF2142 domain-containing protein [Vagococcus lutrae]|uniref:DUF2142 domain-containing protein n=1 Tax=Vagococcus lutrae TaxID=81947 RepID=UPI002A8008BD|nr:DUF2142 domain-containing protein [Vagococcus lutrae]MDY3706257.1 DUF2142 domain-containing protein [Vagococcus lutrae]
MKKNKLWLTFAIVVLSFIIATVIEIGGFNFSTFFWKNTSNDYTVVTENLEVLDKEKGIYRGEEERGHIKIKAPLQYVKKLSFELSNIDRENARFSVIVNKRDVYNKTNTPTPDRWFNEGTRVININEKLTDIDIYIDNVHDVEFQMGSFKLSNQFSFNKVRWIVIAAITFNLLLLGTLFFHNPLELKTAQLTFVTILIFGTLFSFLTPPHHTWDEYQHLIKSYNVAQGNWFMTNEDIVSYPKGLDYLDFYSDMEYQSKEEFVDVLQRFETYKTGNHEELILTSTAVGNLFISYIFSAIGMKLAILLNLPIIYLLWFGRIANLIFYAVISHISINKIPHSKNLLGLYAALPTNIFIAASLCADVTAMGFLIYGVATLFYIIDKKKQLSSVDIGWLLVAFSFVTYAKLTYAPFFLLMFLLTRESFSSKKQFYITRILTIITMAATAISAVLYNKQFGLNQWVKEGVDFDAQVSFVLTHPFQYLKIVLDFFLTNISGLVTNMLTMFAYLGPVKEIMSTVILLSIFFLIIVDKKNENTEVYSEISTFGTISGYISVLGALGLSLTALYVDFTPVRSQTIEGFQGRYLLPILFPLLFLYRFPKIKHEYQPLSLIKFATSMMCLLNIVGMVHLMGQFYM